MQIWGKKSPIVTLSSKFLAPSFPPSPPPLNIPGNKLLGNLQTGLLGIHLSSLNTTLFVQGKSGSVASEVRPVLFMFAPLIIYMQSMQANGAGRECIIPRRVASLAGSIF